MHPLRALTLILASAVALAACGGDDTLSAEEYREQGNAACDAYEKKVSALPEPKSLGEVAEYAGDAQQELTSLIDTLDELSPPDDLQTKHDELVKLGRQSADVLGDLSEAGASGKESEIQSVLKRGSELDTQSDALAGELGLDRCADRN